MSALWDPGREGFLLGEINWGATPVIKAALVRSYAFSASHKWVSDVTGAGGVLRATSTALGSKTGIAGVADAGDVNFPTVASDGQNITSVIIFQASLVTGGSDAASNLQRLIAFIDQAGGLPATPNGGDIAVSWDPGTNRIFKL